MGWSIGYDDKWKRDIGYGVPSICDHRGCTEEIDRGLFYVCGGDAHGGEYGCGLFFCSEHLYLSVRRPQLCARCFRYRKPFRPTPDTRRWMRWKLTDESWQRWRDENPEQVRAMKGKLKEGRT